MLHAEGDAHDGDAAEKSEDGMCGSNLPPAEDNPKDVENDVEAACHALPVLDLTSEGPQGEGAELHQLRPKGNTDDGDTKEESDNPVHQSHQETAQYEPKEIAYRLHRSFFLSANVHLFPYTHNSRADYLQK